MVRCTLLILFSFISVSVTINAQSIELVKDFGERGVNDFPQEVMVVNSKLFFTYKTAPDGWELWMSDGTSAGTKVVKDINPGIADAHVINLEPIGNTLYFSADDGVHGFELWRTDGTDAGTSMVKDINPGIGDGMSPSRSTGTKNQIAFNNILYFAGNDGIKGMELWQTDGTLLGTTLVMDVVDGVNSSNPTSFAINNSAVYLVADNYLFKTDGTQAGTVKLASNSYPVFVSGVGAAMGKVFFQAQHVAGAYQMCASDGTPSGTKLFKTIYPGGFGRCSEFNEINNNLMVFVGENDLGRELWVSNNTPEGTMIIKDIKPGMENGIPYGNNIKLNGTTVLFSADDGVNGNELWKTDGTAAGTILVKDINPGTKSSGIFEKTLFQKKVYFNANNDLTGSELWVSDGTEIGTKMVKDLASGANSTSPFNLVEFQQHLYFFTPFNPLKLLRYDGVEFPSVDPPVTAIEAPAKHTEMPRFSYPNPSEGKISLIEAVASVSVTNMLGCEETFIQTIEFQTNMQGVCILKIITKKGERVMEKLVIN